jgi:hypothetical protein
LPGISALRKYHIIKYGNAINGILDLDYYFTPSAGISIGIGYNSFASQLSLDTWSSQYQTTDSESESYEMRISGTEIVENQKISFLTIPICFTFRFPADGKIGFNLKGGIGLNIPIAKKYDGTGTFTYDGYYPAYPVLIQDYLPYFPSNLNTSSSGELQIKSMNTSLFVSGGGFYSLNESIQLILGINFSKTLGNISTYEPDANFMLTTKADELNSFMAGTSNAGLQAFGLSIGIRYNLK